MCEAYWIAVIIIVIVFIYYIFTISTNEKANQSNFTLPHEVTSHLCNNCTTEAFTSKIVNDEPSSVDIYGSWNTVGGNLSALAEQVRKDTQNQLRPHRLIGIASDR